MLFYLLGAILFLYSILGFLTKSNDGYRPFKGWIITLLLSVIMFSHTSFILHVPYNYTAVYQKKCYTRGTYLKFPWENYELFFIGTKILVFNNFGKKNNFEFTQKIICEYEKLDIDISDKDVEAYICSNLSQDSLFKIDTFAFNLKTSKFKIKNIKFFPVIWKDSLIIAEKMKYIHAYELEKHKQDLINLQLKTLDLENLKRIKNAKCEAHINNIIAPSLSKEILRWQEIKNIPGN